MWFRGGPTESSFCRHSLDRHRVSRAARSFRSGMVSIWAAPSRLDGFSTGCGKDFGICQCVKFTRLSEIKIRIGREVPWTDSGAARHRFQWRGRISGSLFSVITDPHGLWAAASEGTECLLGTSADAVTPPLPKVAKEGIVATAHNFRGKLGELRPSCSLRT